MKTNFLKSIFSLAFIASLSTSCVDDEYATPTFDCVETTLVKNKEVSEIPATALQNTTVDSGRLGNGNPDLRRATRLDGSDG